MNTIEYAYILKVAEEGSIQRAADLLFVSTSTLSKCIANYEKKYQVKLFAYQDKQMQFTPAGIVFAEHTKKIISLCDKMEREMSDLVNFYSGKIRIGMPLNYNSDIVNQTVIAFKKIYPLVTISIVKGNNERIEQKLLSGEIDIAFDLSTKNLTVVNVIPFYEEELTLIVSKNHRLAKKARKKEGFLFRWIDINEAAGEKFVCLPPKAPSEIYLAELCRKCALHPNRVIQVTTIREVQKCVAEHLGIGIMFASRKYSKSEQCVNLSVGEKPIRQMHTIAYRKDFFFNKDVEEFVKIYGDVFKIPSDGK